MKYQVPGSLIVIFELTLKCFRYNTSYVVNVIITNCATCSCSKLARVIHFLGENSLGECGRKMFEDIVFTIRSQTINHGHHS